MWFSATSRVTFGLISLAISVWSVAFGMGMVPDRQSAVVAGRAALCENVAWNCSLLARRNDWRTIENALGGLVKQNAEVQSAAVRHPDGSLLVSVGPHADHWDLSIGNQSTASHMRLPILSGGSAWGAVEVRFREDQAKGLRGWLRHPLVSLAMFVVAATYLLYFLYLHKMLRLAEGRLVADNLGRPPDTTNNLGIERPHGMGL